MDEDESNENVSDAEKHKSTNRSKDNVGMDSERSPRMVKRDRAGSFRTVEKLSPPGSTNNAGHSKESSRLEA